MAINLVALGIAAACGLGALLFNKFSGANDDNIAEETAEVIIKENTGLDVDLSPATPERK